MLWAALLSSNSATGHQDMQALRAISVVKRKCFGVASVFIYMHITETIG